MINIKKYSCKTFLLGLATTLVIGGGTIVYIAPKIINNKKQEMNSKELEDAMFDVNQLTYKTTPAMDFIFPDIYINNPVVDQLKKENVKIFSPTPIGLIIMETEGEHKDILSIIDLEGNRHYGIRNYLENLEKESITDNQYENDIDKRLKEFYYGNTTYSLIPQGSKKNTFNIYNKRYPEETLGEVEYINHNGTILEIYRSHIDFAVRDESIVAPDFPSFILLSKFSDAFTYSENLSKELDLIEENANETGISIS
jgi:hypothetical protein